MQEYQLQIREALINGLRPIEDVPAGSKYLVECKGLRPGPAGLRSVEEVKNPFASDWSETFPFPQLLRGSEVTLLAGEDSICQVGEDWSLEELKLYSVSDRLEVETVVPGGFWHMADFGKVWVLFNGSCTVISLKKGAVFGEEDRLMLQDAVTMNTGCSFRGRLVFGGFSPSDFWGNNWMSLWNSVSASEDYSIDSEMSGLRKNFVAWTTIGGGDLLHVLLPDDAVKGLIKEADHSLEEPFFLDLWRRNEAGFRPMPWSGDVLCVKQLGKGVMVYGSNGISLLFPVVEPFPTFGLQEIADFGIADRGAVGGDINQHALTDEGGKLWTIGADYKLQQKGYKEYFLPSLGGSFAVSLDSNEQRFYISSASGSFILTETGLGETAQSITSLLYEKELVGIADERDIYAFVMSGAFDFGYRDLKTVTMIEVGLLYNIDAEAFAVVDFRYSKTEAFQRSAPILLNEEGAARVQITALEFRFGVLIEAVETVKDVQIDYINVRWQSSAARTKRGLGADTANA